MARIGPDGGYFYTNRLSKKGIELEENANAGAVRYRDKYALRVLYT